MIIINDALLLGVAAVITSFASLVWSFRRRK